MLTLTMRPHPNPGVQQLYQRLSGLVTRLESNDGKENSQLRDAVREFFTHHRDEIRAGLDAFNNLSPALKDLTAKMGIVNQTWRSWSGGIESTFRQAVGDLEAEEERKDIERAVGLKDVPEGADVSLLPTGYESIERALRYAAYWTPDD